MENTLYYGDNLDILRRYIPDESVDLVYLDPPFKSDQNYNILFKEQNGSRAASQIRAFEDTWIWTQESEAIYTDLVIKGDKVADCLRAFRTFLGPCDMLAYLVMMAPRLVELRRVMKSTASIYLHCDPTASHYLKMLMDAVFGAKNFRNELIWCYSTSGRPRKEFAKKHDVILFYSKTRNYFWNNKEVRIPYSQEYIKSHFRDKDSRGRLCRKRFDAGKWRVYYPEEGMIPNDWWEIPYVNSMAKERLGYPTQKPELLLERIIKASSKQEDVILDPFCGCGTAIAAAQKLNRYWIGIDITHLAINLIKHRLLDTFGNQLKFRVIGEPTSLPDAKALAASDPYQFQFWALGLVGARPVEERKGADRGIDGKIVFQADKPAEFKEVLIQVKAGHTSVAHIRDLRGVVDRENAAIGVLISMENPTRQMKAEAASAGFYESITWGKKYPKIQLLTIEQVLGGKQIDMPPIRQVGTTFKKAKKYVADQGQQLEIER